MVGEFDFVSTYNASGVLTTVYTPVGKAEQVRGWRRSLFGGGARSARVAETRHENDTGDELFALGCCRSGIRSPLDRVCWPLQLLRNTLRSWVWQMDCSNSSLLGGLGLKASTAGRFATVALVLPRFPTVRYSMLSAVMRASYTVISSCFFVVAPGFC